MTDLINNINQLNPEVRIGLLQKYNSIIEGNGNHEYIPMLYVIDISVNYINNNHTQETKDWKAWSCFLIKKLWDLKQLKSETDIYSNIERFFKYKEKEYKEYLDDITMYSDEYYKNVYFIDKYIKEFYP